MTVIAEPSAGHEAELADAAGVLNVANARLVQLAETMLSDETWVGSGIHTPAHWLTYRTGVSPERARVVVRVAERRAAFPCVMAAFDAGELSLEQVAELVRAPAWADERVLDWGRVATVARLRRTIRREWFTESPDQNEPGEPTPDDRDRMTTSVTDDHRWHLHGELDLGRGAVIDAAMTEARESLFEEGQASITNADCLVEICQRYLDGIHTPVRRDRSKVWLHLDITDGSATGTDGWRLPGTVRDRICCDTTVQPVWEREGRPFSVGRAQRTVPERTRRIIERRDGGCRVPGCTNDRFVEIHHIVHWLHGGPTDTGNLLSLCPHHHRLHHQGLIGIAGDADHDDGMEFTDAYGSPLPPSGCVRPCTTDPPRPAKRYQPPLMGRVDHAWVGLGWIHPDEQRRRQAQHRHLD